MIVLVKRLPIGTVLMNDLLSDANARLVKVNLNAMRITILLVLILTVIVTVLTVKTSTLGF